MKSLIKCQKSSRNYECITPLKLDERVRRMVVEDKIKSGHARALLSIKDGELQYETALQIFDGNLTVRETEKLVKNC